MIRLTALLVSIMLASVAAAAETIALRSGEHAGFSRLVLPLPTGANWTLKQNERQVELALTLPGIVFDTAQVFQRIPRTRLIEVAQIGPGSTLALNLGCDCTVTGFTQGGAYLVIDITDPKPEALLPPAMTRAGNLTAYRFRFSTGSPTEAAKSPVPGNSDTEDTVHDVVDEMLRPGGTPDPTRLSLINASERRLIEQLDRAADQGLLDPRVSFSPRLGPAPAIGQAQHPRAIDEDRTATVEGQLRAGLHVGNVSVTTAVDRDRAKPDPQGTHADPDGVCAASALVDLASWGDGRPFAVQIGEMRSDLFSEFDRAEPDRILGLARMYLYHGFGAEARRVLSLTSEPTPGHAAARALANLVDGHLAVEDNPFVGAQGCDGDVALWAVLSDPVIEGINRTAVQRAFARLPVHLRAHLGPLLAEQFAAMGDRQTAGALLRAVARTGVVDNPAADLAEASVAGLENDMSAATGKLEQVAESGSDQAPTALIRLIESHWRERSAIAPDLPDLAASYALEFRQARIGPDLRRAHVLSLALTDRFDEAMTAAETLAGVDGPMARADAKLSVLDLITERANDMVFLRHALPVAEHPLADLPVETGDAIARRLLDLGFARAAMPVLETDAKGATTANRRLMRSEAALDLGLPHRALVEILGLDTASAARLRATALSRIGDFRQAGEILETEDPEAAAREFWLSAEPATPDDDAKPPDRNAIPSGNVETKYRTIARLTARLAETVDTGNTDMPLAEARSLIETSASVRQDIGALLDSVGPGQSRPGE